MKLKQTVLKYRFATNDLITRKRLWNQFLLGVITVM